MAYPIITLVFAIGVAFLAFKTNGTETGMADETAPAAIDTTAPADDGGEVEE